MFLKYSRAAIFLVTLIGSSVLHAGASDVIALLGNATFPEGILAISEDRLLIGGFGDGSLQMVSKDLEVSYFSAPGENGMVIAVGFELDVANNRLWVANFNFDSTGTGVPGSQLKVFDLDKNSLIATIPNDESFIPGTFFNEVAIDKAGNVYVSDTFNPYIWTASFDSTEPTILVNNTLLSNPAPDQPFDLNGLAITLDEKYLIASIMDRLDAGDGRLVRIDLEAIADGMEDSVLDVELTGNDEAIAAFAGSDGMFFLEDSMLVMVNVYSPAGAIMTAEFDEEFTTAELKIRDAFQSVYNRPTASGVWQGKLWTVNSQLDHIIDDNNGALGSPPELPFQVVGVPLGEVIAEANMNADMAGTSNSTTDMAGNGTSEMGTESTSAAPLNRCVWLVVRFIALAGVGIALVL